MPGQDDRAGRRMPECGARVSVSAPVSRQQLLGSALVEMVCPEFRGVEILDCYAVISSGGQREQTRWTGQARISCGVETAGNRSASRRAEGGGRRPGPGDQ